MRATTGTPSLMARVAPDAAQAVLRRLTPVNQPRPNRHAQPRRAGVRRPPTGRPPRLRSTIWQFETARHRRRDLHRLQAIANRGLGENRWRDNPAPARLVLFSDAGNVPSNPGQPQGCLPAARTAKTKVADLHLAFGTPHPAMSRSTQRHRCPSTRTIEEIANLSGGNRVTAVPPSPS